MTTKRMELQLAEERNAAQTGDVPADWPRSRKMRAQLFNGSGLHLADYPKGDTKPFMALKNLRDYGYEVVKLTDERGTYYRATGKRAAGPPIRPVAEKYRAPRKAPLLKRRERLPEVEPVPDVPPFGTTLVVMALVSDANGVALGLEEPATARRWFAVLTDGPTS